ncbi:PREDICTED: uncharacterized protein LOC108763626 [Trachymyrmex cornetzi]|uniref:uncharacterized protein LOC108763626 n=1 Tax=Trachymyrmex cornetzi TaxID=471704 RepID=UPI00084F133D|nr:PREDICTED: uncharacterized protein LOC108763626 [Trachymyrmex cornetzi]XP_018366911.1 PREDICTED: uncharacterized protein LOC108763626 [Trachymyrmex cornetzi]XP_018366912.1 PREDICTED: uncharacterized protein LOC108763626 [Trachymyrmex cornetzi]
MGQAWCKEKTSKAQDSKSPLDRVFVRCAHRIYPSLKEEGSVLGGATQRVTSSEIGYAGSPPREVLTRGRSIDSVDRPFHPSDWVDVNLEVPSPPRADSTLTNSIVDTSLRPAVTPTFNCANLKDVTPVPPPRRKKRNRSRPLPPKPDEIPENVTNNLRRGDTSEEPLYFSVRSPKTNNNNQNGEVETWGTEKTCTDDSKYDGRKTKEIYEHKVNGTGRIISSEVVSGKRTPADKKTSRTSESNHHHRKVLENEEYERFARNQSIKDSSTPNRQDRRKSKELERRIRDSSRDDDRPEANTRTKNYSTVSLPNYDELDVSRHPVKGMTNDEERVEEKMKSKRPVRSSTVSLPAESFLSPFSEKTSVCLEDYFPRRGSMEHLSLYQVLEKLGSSENEVIDGRFMKYDPSKLEDWDLSDISNCDSNQRLSVENTSRIENRNNKLVESAGLSEGVDVVDHSRNVEAGQTESTEMKISCVQDMTSSLQKPESFGKVALPIIDSGRESKYTDDWLADQNRSLKYFDPPKMSEICQVSPTCELGTSPVRREPFFLNEALHRSICDTIERSCRNGAVVRESDRSDQSRLIFGRSLSNESEPFDDPYESKELRAHSDVTNKLIRTISEESLPQEMLEEVDEEIVDFFDEKLAKDATNKLKKDYQDQRIKTPPPSPEPKIKAQILDNDHSTLLKVLNDEVANESNLSSMTPSLTELEVALSDMLEKEDQSDEITKRENTNEECKQIPVEKLLEPEIVPIEKHNVIDRNVSDQCSINDGILVDSTPENKTDRLSVSLEQPLGDSTPKKRKVSFCTWEEKVMMDVDLKNDEESPCNETEQNLDEMISPDSKDSVVKSELESSSDFFESIATDMKDSVSSVGEAPAKPNRLFQNLENLAEGLEQIPTPPRRKNKSLGVTKESIRTIDNYHENPNPGSNDRLI